MTTMTRPTEVPASDDPDAPTTRAGAKAAKAAKGKAANGKGGKGGKDAKGGKSKKKLIIAVIAVVAVLGGVYQFMLKPKPKPGPPKAGEVVKLEPTIVNLADGHYLRVGINIQLVDGKATAEKFDTSEAQQMVIDTFTGRPRGTLTNATRLKLESKLKSELQHDKSYEGDVYDIFFNQFLID